MATWPTVGLEPVGEPEGRDEGRSSPRARRPAARFGRIDCLATIEEQTAFEDVLDDLDWMELDGTPVRVLSLPRLIEVKKKLSRPKDQLALLQLQATLEERQAKSED